MGYKRPETVYVLRFDEREGLEVKARSVDLGRLLDVADMADQLKSGKASSFAEVRELFDLFGKRLKSWNLEEDDGSPIAATSESVFGLEFGFAMELVLAWFDAIASVPDPLAGRSTAGSPLEVPSMPMEPLSVSLAS